MKHNFSKILAKAAGVLCICALFASFSPSLDGRAVVADEGVFPEGLFAKTVGYLPGDVLSVNNISGNATVDILVIGALDPSEGVAIMLSPEAAKEIGITKNSNNIVKITKRTGQDERVYGTAVIAKNSGLDEYYEEEARAAEETPVQSAAVEEPAEEFTEEEAPEESFAEEESSDEDFEEESFEDEEFEEETSEDEEFEEESEEASDEDEEFLEEDSEDEEFEEKDSEDEDFEEDDEELLEDEEPGDFEEESDEEEDLSEEYEEEAPEDFEDESEEYAEEDEEAFEEESEEFEDDSDAEYEESEELEALSDESEEEEPETELISDESEAYEETEEELPAEETEEGPEAYVDDELSVLPSYNVVEPAEPEETEEASEEGTSEDEYDAIVLVPTDEYPPEAEEVVEENSFQEDMVEDLLLDTKTVPEVRANEVFEIEENAYEPVVVEPVREEPKNSFEKYTVGSLSELKKGSYYIQIAVLRDENNVKDIINKYAKNYPVVLVPTSSGTARQVLIGPLTVDEYGTILARFKAYGFKDAFLRKIK